MRRKLGSVASTLALLLIAGGAAAVNVRVLDANRSEPSMLTAQTAAEVAGLDTSSTVSAADVTEAQIPATNAGAADVVAAAAVEPAASTAPTQTPTPMTTTTKPKVLGSVGGGRDDDDDDDDDDHEGRDHDDDDDDNWRRPFGDRPRLRGEFIPLTRDQVALLRVAALAQVSPAEARDAANGTGSTAVVTRVKNAAAQIGVPLASIGAVTDIPPERSRRHGGDDDDDHDDDDDD